MLTATLISLLPLALAAPQLVPRQSSPGEILPSSIISHDLANPPSPNTCLPSSPLTHPTTARHRLPNGTETGASLLYTFTYPPAAANRLCWLEFTTTPPTTLLPNPGAQLDVFTQWAPGSCEDGAAGNNRDVQLGRLDVSEEGVATWAAVYNGFLTEKGPCGEPGTVVGVEIVAVGDDGEVGFPQGEGKGLRIRYG